MSDWISATIIDDSDSETNMEVIKKLKEELKIKDKEIKELKEELKEETIIVKKTRKYTKKVIKAKKELVDELKKEVEENVSELNVEETKVKEEIKVCLLKKFHNSDINIIEVGADEVGRGPMLGRVYSGAVVLPKDDSFDHFRMKDSKKFNSKTPQKIQEVAEYIKKNAIAWAVEYEDERVIDEINILQATQSAMHKAIRSVLKQIKGLDTNNLLLLIDGNYFKPLTICNKSNNRIENAKYETIEGGDNKFTSIAAASILAKVARDKYIEELCLENPELIERYGIDSNKGYGSKRHMDGIKKYGITKWHRRTFGICKTFS
jgi:ribonuclease HII